MWPGRQLKTLAVLLIALASAIVWIAAILVAGPLTFALVQSLPEWCAGRVQSFCALYPQNLDATAYAQLSATLLSSGFAALAAIGASWLTAMFLLRQQRAAEERSRRKAAAAIALEIGAFLKTFERLLPAARLERRLSADRKRIAVGVQINRLDLSAALPPRATYDQVLREIALLEGVGLPVALFYQQAGRVLADLERGWVGAPAFGHLFVKAAGAILALAPFSRIGDETVAGVNEAIWILLHPNFQKEAWSASYPMAVYMWKDDDTACIRAWADLVAKRKIKAVNGAVAGAYPVPSVRASAAVKPDFNGLRASLGIAARAAKSR